MRLPIKLSFATLLFCCFIKLQAQSPVMHWDFEKNDDSSTVEVISLLPERMF